MFGVHVGSNDLSEKETNTYVAEMKNLIQRTKISHKATTVHTLPAFERVGEHDFNEKVMKFNKEIQQFCKNESKCEFIKQKMIFGNNKAVYSDGIHFSALGQKNLVRIMKTHLNPILGLKPYTEYQTQSNQQYHRQKPNFAYANQQRRIGYQQAPRRSWEGNEHDIDKLIHRLLQLT